MPPAAVWSDFPDMSARFLRVSLLMTRGLAVFVLEVLLAQAPEVLALPPRGLPENVPSARSLAAQRRTPPRGPGRRVFGPGRSGAG